MENSQEKFSQSYINEVDEKIEKELNNLNEIINNINLDLDDLLQRAEAKVKAVQDDYEDLEADFNKVKTKFFEFEFKIDIQNLANYLIFLDIKSSIRLIDEKLKMTKHIINIYNHLNIDY